MIIRNDSKSVKVLKAAGLPALRLFPGHNTVNANTIRKYFKNNPAADNMRKECLVKLEDSDISPAEKMAADEAKAKNDELNKAQKDANLIKEQSAKIEKQGAQIKDLSEKLENLMITLGDKKGK